MNNKKGTYILMFSKWYPNKMDPQFGVFIQKQAQAISAKRDIIVYSSHAHSDPDQKLFSLEINHEGKLKEYRMYYRKNSSVISPLLNLLLYLRAWHRTKKIILTENGIPSVAHAYILLRPAILAYLFSLTHRIPFVISEQWSGYTNGKFQARPAIVKQLSKFLFRKAKARTAVSRFLKTNMQSLGFAEPIQVIPNVIEIQKPKIKAEDGKINILVVADLVDEIKNISGTIRAFALALKQTPTLRLRIIGHGIDEINLKQLAVKLEIPGNTIHFDGLKNNAEVYEALWNCDFLVMNSRFETFSLICAEALSCGKPVISSRCGGPEEFIDSSNGILIPVDDTDALTEAILQMSKSYSSYSQDNLRNQASKQFNSESVGNSFDLLYSAIS